MTEQNNQEEILELDAEELQEYLSGSTDKLPPIEIPLEFYDTDEFYRGINETSYLAGVITALLNTGISEGFISDYLLNQETIKHNIEMAKLNNETNIEITKNQKIATEKSEL